MKDGAEGLVVKTLSSAYEPAMHSTHWLKVRGGATGDTPESVTCVGQGGSERLALEAAETARRKRWLVGESSHGAGGRRGTWVAR